MIVHSGSLHEGRHSTHAIMKTPPKKYLDFVQIRLKSQALDDPSLEEFWGKPKLLEFWIDQFV
jgi:uncharacterized Rmd1/YagE family protein